MASDAYMQLLRDPRWQRKRLEIMQRDEWRCVKCNDGSTTLNVHHTQYLPGRRPWEYPDEVLVTVCEDCHEWDHRLKRNSAAAIGAFSFVTPVGMRLAGYLVVLQAINDPADTWKHRTPVLNEHMARGVAEACGLSVDEVVKAKDELGWVDLDALLATKK